MSPSAHDRINPGARRPGHVALLRLGVGAILLVACAGEVPATPPFTGSATPVAFTGSPTLDSTPSSPPAVASGTPGQETAIASPTKAAGEGAQAVNTASAYIGHLVAARYPAAWQLLSAQSQERFGSLEQFAAERASYYRTAGPRFTLSAPDDTAVALATWLPAGFDGVAERAFVVRVDHPAIASNNAGWEILVVAPDGVDVWKVWVMR